MAKIATYTAPIERIRPNDLGYTANVQLGRRLAGFASERAGTIRSDAAAQAAALRQGGALESQNILTSRRADLALMRFLEEGANPVAAAAARNTGGGGGRGSLGNQGDSTGGTQQQPLSRIAGPAQAAQAAAAMAQVLGATGKYVEQPGRYPLDPYVSKGSVLKSYDVSGQALRPQEGYDSSGYNVGLSAEVDRTAAPDYSYPLKPGEFALGGGEKANFINLGKINQAEQPTAPDENPPYYLGASESLQPQSLPQRLWNNFVSVVNNIGIGGVEGDTNQILSDREE